VEEFARSWGWSNIAGEKESEHAELRTKRGFNGRPLGLGGDRSSKLSIPYVNLRYVTCVDIISHNQGRAAIIVHFECMCAIYLSEPWLKDHKMIFSFFGQLQCPDTQVYLLNNSVFIIITQY
jgi:hypothetical protein